MQSDFLICLDERTGVSTRLLRVATWVVRIALTLVFASIVWSRFGLWGAMASHVSFDWWLPSPIQQGGSWIATSVEILLILGLLSGWKARWIALLSAIVLLLHGLALCASLGPASSLAHFAFAAASAAFLLFAIQPSASA